MGMFSCKSRRQKLIRSGNISVKDALNVCHDNVVIDRINQIREFAKKLGGIELTAKWVWLTYRVSNAKNGKFLGIDIYDNYFQLWFKLPQVHFESSGLHIRQHYKKNETKIEIHPEDRLEYLFEHIKIAYNGIHN